ncbi:hypothetical protein Tco_0869152 [Tanacetum coccineum]
MLINLSPSFKALGDAITDVLQNIPCSPECKIVGQLLLDLTATAVVSVVYLQQFWKTVSKVLDTKDTIKFKLDRLEIVYTVDMFHATLQLPMETPANSSIAPATMKVIEPFMQTVVIKEFVIKTFLTAYSRRKMLFMSVYLTGNVTVLGMLIPDAFITDEIHATGDYREYETVFVRKPSTTSIPPLSDDQERDDIAEATLLSLALHKTALAAKAQENVAKVRENLVEEDIEKMVEGKEEEESYASDFADSVFNDDEDDFGTRIEPRNHKENPENVDDDDENDKGKKDEKKDDDGKKDDYKDKDNDDHTDHTLVRTQAMGSMEIRKEKLQTPIPSPSRSPRKNLSSDKNLSQELTESVDKVLHEIIPQIASRATNDLIKNNVKRSVVDTIIQERNAFRAKVPAMVTNEFIDQAPRIIKELFKSYVSNNVIQVHPTTSTSTATTSSVVLQQ